MPPDPLSNSTEIIYLHLLDRSRGVAKQAVLFFSYTGGHCQTLSITPCGMQTDPSSTSLNRSVLGDANQYRPCFAVHHPRRPRRSPYSHPGSFHSLGKAASWQTRERSPCSPLLAGTPWIYFPRAQGLKKTLEVLCQETSSRRRGPDWRVSVPTPLEMTESSCWLNSLYNFNILFYSFFSLLPRLAVTLRMGQSYSWLSPR